jgi:hypothetical protein
VAIKEALRDSGKILQQQNNLPDPWQGLKVGEQGLRELKKKSVFIS